MIEGEVSATNEMTLPLQIYAANGDVEPITAVIDTGFSDYLSLPPVTIAQLGLTFSERQTFFLADNNPVLFDLYLATVIWEGRDRNILVLAAEGTPLIGMRHLKEAILFSDIRDGGKVLVRGF